MEPNYSIFPEKKLSYAGFWIRFGAAFLDGLILAPVGFIYNYVANGNMLDSGLIGPDGTYSFSSSYFTQLALTTIIGWLYGALQESGKHQATLGKRAVGLKVTNLDGDRISFGQATARHFGKWLSLITLCIGYLMMVWDSKKQTLHDKIAGTLVVNTGNE